MRKMCKIKVYAIFMYYLDSLGSLSLRRSLKTAMSTERPRRLLVK